MATYFDVIFALVLATHLSCICKMSANQKSTYCHKLDNAPFFQGFVYILKAANEQSL